MADQEIWNRLPGETDKAWNAFQLWLQHDRVIMYAYRAYRIAAGLSEEEAEALQSPPGGWGHWSRGRSYSGKALGLPTWKQRALALDQHLAAQKVQAHAAALRKYEDRIVKLVVGPLLDRVEAMLAWPLSTQVVEEDGQAIIVAPTKWNVRDAATLVQAFDRILRMAAQEPTDRPMQHQSQVDFSTMPDEILDDKLNELLQQYAAAAQGSAGGLGNPFAEGKGPADPGSEAAAADQEAA